MTDAITDDVREPLWSDARIDKAAMDDWNYSTSYEAARSALRRMRDEYSAHIAELEQERAELRAKLAAALWENRWYKREFARHIMPTPPIPLSDADMQLAIKRARELGLMDDMSSPELDAQWLHDEAMLRNSGSHT